MHSPCLAYLHQRACEPTPREVAQAVDINPGVQQFQDHVMNRGAVAPDLGLEIKPLSHGHDGDAMPPQVSAEEDDVTRLYALRLDREVVLYNPDACCVDEYTVGLALV